jgi:hypothetical protein
MVLNVFSTTQIRDILSWPRVTLVASIRLSRCGLCNSSITRTRYSYLMNCLVSQSAQARLIDYYMSRQFWTSWLLARSLPALGKAINNDELSPMSFKLSNGASMASATLKISPQCLIIVTVDSYSGATSTSLLLNGHRYDDT